MENKIIIIEEIAREFYKKGGNTLFGTDVINAWFEMDGYSFPKDDDGFNRVLKTKDENDGLNTKKPLQYAIQILETDYRPVATPIVENINFIIDGLEKVVEDTYSDIFPKEYGRVGTTEDIYKIREDCWSKIEDLKNILNKKESA